MIAHTSYAILGFNGRNQIGFLNKIYFPTAKLDSPSPGPKSHDVSYTVDKSNVTTVTPLPELVCVCEF